MHSTFGYLDTYTWMHIVILKSLFEYNFHINKIIIFSVCSPCTVCNLKVKYIKKYLSKYYANVYTHLSTPFLEILFEINLTESENLVLTWINNQYIAVK